MGRSKGTHKPHFVYRDHDVSVSDVCFGVDRTLKGFWEIVSMRNMML